MIEVNCKRNGYCGKCCYETEMPLTREDLNRIKSLGFKPEDFSVVVEGVRRLRNVGGKCFFLKNNECTIYEFRPEGCRIYPLVLNDEGEVVVDDLCPLKDEIEREISREVLEKAKSALQRIVREVYNGALGV